MKQFLNLFLLTATLGASVPGQIQSTILNPRVVERVLVATNRVTTLSFPSAIGAIDAAGVTSDPKTPAEFILAHTPGTAFLSLRALRHGARANLNIRWAQRIYVFELFESSTPVLSLVLEPPKSVSSLATEPIGILDRAKAYVILKKQVPEAVAGVEARTFDPPRTFLFEGLRVHLTQAYRFEDALVFTLILQNTFPECLDVPKLGVRIGSQIYQITLSDAPPSLESQEERTVFVAIVGSPTTGRNDLSLENDFRIEALP